MRKLLLENMGMKVAAVVMAITLWFFVTSRGQSEVLMDVPIELKNIPSGFESVRQGIKTVSVSIKGQERLLRNMKPAAVRVHVDLSKAKKGKGTYYINNEDVKLPSTMTVTNISPSSVIVALEETVIRTAPVQAVVLGTPKKGFFVGSVEVNPREMTIEGARSEVSRIKSLRTEPIDITDMDETSVQEVRLDTGGRNVRTEVQEVNVKIVIKK
ncbi:MAG: CdaR family protein [Nitrospirota bacterium]